MTTKNLFSTMYYSVTYKARSNPIIVVVKCVIFWEILYC